MKNILALSLLILLFTITNSYVYSDSTIAPVIITKVELWSPPTFAEEVNLCQDGKTLGPWSYQWIELRNLRNETITITDEVELNFTRGAVITMSGFTLGPNESCLIQTADQVTTRMGPGGSEGNGPPNGYDSSLVSIQYTVKTGNIITKYQDSTPELSDTFGDTRIWQLIDGKWAFKEYVMPDVKRIILSKTTDDDSIRVNLTLAEKMQPTLMTKFKVDFIDDVNHLNNVKYEITYSGANHMKQTDNGFALNGTDIKFMEFTQPDSIMITISIFGIDGKIFDKPQTVEFSSIIIGGTNKSLYYPLLSPLKQFKSGITIDQIQCKEGFAVVIKKSNGNPNCVKHETLEKLRERGWATVDQLENKIITPEDNDKLIDIKKGESFIVKLDSGYDWRISIDNQTVIDSDYSDIRYSGSQSVYRAHNSGHAILTGIGDPLCLSLDPPCMSPSILFQLNINVK